LGQAVTGQLEDVQNGGLPVREPVNSQTRQVADWTTGYAGNIYIFIRKNYSFKKKKLQKNKEKRNTQRVKEHNMSNAY